MPSQSKAFSSHPARFTYFLVHKCLFAKRFLISSSSSNSFNPVAGTDKREIPSAQSFFAVSISPRCALYESEWCHSVILGQPPPNM